MISQWNLIKKVSSSIMHNEDVSTFNFWIIDKVLHFRPYKSYCKIHAADAAKNDLTSVLSISDLFP